MEHVTLAARHAPDPSSFPCSSRCPGVGGPLEEAESTDRVVNSRARSVLDGWHSMFDGPFDEQSERTKLPGQERCVISPLPKRLGEDRCRQ